MSAGAVNLRRAVAVALIATSWCGATAAIARADESDACVASYEQAQVLRMEIRLVEARDKLLICAQPACPQLLTADCARWLRQVDDSVPSIVLGARDADGKDLPNTRVFLDGRRVAERIDGTALVVDPGAHTIRFENAARGVAEQHLVARQGEKNRLVSVTFPRPDAATRETRPVPVLAYVLGAVGVASIAAGTALDVSARSTFQSLKESCHSACATSDVADGRRRMLVGDVVLGVGVLALGLGVYLWLSQRPTEAPAR
jgi:hypothetical protein